MWRVLTLLAAVSIWASPAFGQFNAANGACAASSASITFSLTVSAVSNSVLVVGAIGQSSTALNVTGVTFNGDALGAVTGGAVTLTAASELRSEQWFRVAPDVATANVIVTYSGANTTECAGAVVWDGLDQGATPYRTPATQTGTAGTTATVAVTSVSGDTVIDTIGCFFNSCAGQEGAGQTTRVSFSQSTTLNVDMSTEAAVGTSTTMSYTVGSGDWWALVGTPFIPVAGAGAVPATFVQLNGTQ